MSDPILDKAIAEAYAACPVDDGIVLCTLEFLHPTFDSPARVVRWPSTGNEPEVFRLGLEPDAPVDPGEAVDFLGAPFEVTAPEREESAPGEITIKIERIAHLLTEHMIAAVKQRDPIRIIYREYMKSMPEAPQAVYSGFSISRATVNQGSVEGKASMIDWLLRPYGRIYTPSEFPGLVRGR